MCNFTCCLIFILNFGIYIKMASSKQAIINDTSGSSWILKFITFNGTADTEANGTFFKTCDIGQVADIWLISKHVKLSDSFSEVLYVDVDAELTLCVYGPTGTKMPCHSNAFEIYVYRGESQPLIPKNGKLSYLLSNFYPVYNITNKTSPNSVNRRENQTFTFTRNNTKCVAFAIRSRGACGRIFHMKMYYFYCERIFINSVMFEKTTSPATGFINVTGNCSLNSQPKNNRTKLQGFCFSNGSWGANYQIKCLCNQGYEPSKQKECSICSGNYYKPNISYSNCMKCPKNNVANSNKTSCKCKDGYHKLPSNSFVLASCYALLKFDEEPSVKSISDDSINITWDRPNTANSLPGHIRYDVKCYYCKETQCNLTYTYAKYDPRQANLTQTFVIVSHLKPETTYEFRIYPHNRLNEGISMDNWTYINQIYKTRGKPPNKSDGNGTDERLNYVLYSVAGVILLILILFAVFLLRRKKRNKKKPFDGLLNNGYELPVNGQRIYIDPTNYDCPEEAVYEFTKELDPSTLHLEMLIGGGEFGDVYRAIMTKEDGSKDPVAVKTLKHDAVPKSEKDFLIEASVMGQFDDPNVVRLEGVVTKSKPRMIVTEFMSNGSLENFLKTMDGNLTHLQLIGMARGVASGMKYLARMKFVHRDLAARNILVNDTLFCKISDFGLSRELETTDSSRGEYATAGGKIPVRWTSPEAIKYKKFSSASDVWSYGVLLWEIMSFAERPYWEWDNFKVIEELDAGFRLPPPLDCPKGVHNLMLLCWKADRSERPSFVDITVVLDRWITSPETMNNENELPSALDEWLKEIKMARYASIFVDAGYRNPSQIVDLKDEDLKDMGITLVGHRHKILKNAGSLKSSVVS